MTGGKMLEAEKILLVGPTISFDENGLWTVLRFVLRQPFCSRTVCDYANLTCDNEISRPQRQRVEPLWIVVTNNGLYKNVWDHGEALPVKNLLAIN